MKLGDIFKISSGGTPDKKKKIYYENGTIPWIKTGDLKEKFVSNDVEQITLQGLNNCSAKLFPAGTVLVAMYGATIGACSILNYQASTNQACAAFLPNPQVLPDYLYYFLSSRKNLFIQNGVGGAQPNISATYLKTVPFKYVPIDVQIHIITVLDKLTTLISLRKQQLAKLDELVKARFVEMFGDPVNNSLGLPIFPMTEICSIIDGDRGKNYPKQEDFSEKGYCLFLNAKNVTSTGFLFEHCMFITKEKDCILNNGKLERGDVVLTTRGTLGNLAFYDNRIPYENVRINSGMVILRMKRKIVLEVFFIEQFKMQLQSIKKQIASGSAQPQLPVSAMDKIRIVLPPIEQQERFIFYTEKIKRTKLKIQQSIDKMELLKTSLMQQYFE